MGQLSMGLQTEIGKYSFLESGIWWIDEEGQEHFDESLSPSTESYFFHHLGQVKLDLAPALVEVSWDNDKVHAKSLETAKSILSDLNRDIQTRLSFYHRGWEFEILGDTLSAAERIEEIEACGSVQVLHDTLISECSIADVFFANARIRHGFQTWDRSTGDFRKADQNDLAKILPHTLIYCPDKGDGNLVYSWIGGDSSIVRILGRQWINLSIGTSALAASGEETQQFVDAIGPGIIKTMETGDPLYQHVRTLVDIEGHEKFWLPYERLLTRHVMRDGRPAVVCDVYATRHIGLSFTGGPR